MFVPVVRERLHQPLARHLAASILRGDLRPGTLLPREAALCAEFGVSRTVVREAVQLLSQCGFLEVRHGTGTVVLSREHWDILDPLVITVMEETGAIQPVLEDLLDLRRMFETEAAALAARRATPQHLEKLGRIVERMRERLNDPPGYLSLDVEFHTTLLEATGNRVLMRLVRRLSGVLHLLMEARYRLVGPSVFASSLEDHAEIFAAVRRRAPEKARVLMRRHLEGAEGSIRQAVLSSLPLQQETA